MLPKLPCFGLVVALSLAAGRPVMAQPVARDEQPVKPSGPAAKKADDLIRSYTSRIEKEIDQGHKEIQRLRAELHELIDVRYDMAEAISELRGELAANGTYSADALLQGQAANQGNQVTPPQGRGAANRRDLFYGLGSALPKDPTPQQREQLRRLAPRSDLKRMIERLRRGRGDTRRSRSTGLQTAGASRGHPGLVPGLRWRNGRRNGRRHGRALVRIDRNDWNGRYEVSAP